MFEKEPPKLSFDKMKYLILKSIQPLKVFERYGVDVIFDSRLASIDEEYQGQNISSDMDKFNESRIREMKYKVFSIETYT